MTILSNGHLWKYSEFLKNKNYSFEKEQILKILSIEEIDNAYSPEQAKDLTSRLVNSIRGRDAKKFSRGIKKIIKESQRENNAD